jgi:carbamoyl-phosphate synthase large subunit
LSARRPLNVLVLGVGGSVSQGILKSLAASSLEHRVISACIAPTSLGLYRADAAYLSPRADAPAFVPWLLEKCERESVDAVLCGVESVLSVLAEQETPLRDLGSVPIVSPPGVLAVGHDKLRTAEWLEEKGHPGPRTALAADPAAVAELVSHCGFPVIVKPRIGKGSAGVRPIADEAELALVPDADGLLVQEMVGDPGSEFTAGCFCDREGELRGTIAMRRTLQHGTTHIAEVGDFPEVRRVAAAIANDLRPLGPLNVQLRLRDGGEPVPFELNVRFSGTTPMRTRFGFAEVETALRHFVLGEPVPDLPDVRSGVAVRYWNEMYVDPEAIEELRRDGRLGRPREAGRIEAWGLEG